MGQITSGVVKYGRTVKTGDYENKRADVEIAWSAVDDDDFQPTLDRAADAAYRKCQDMLGLRHEKTAPTPAPTESAAEPSTRKAPRAARVAAAPTAPTSAPAAQLPPVAAAGASAAAPDDADFPGTTPAEVTDKELHAAAQMAAARIKDSQPIRNLRDKYLEPGGMHLSDIPQAKRQAFLKELETLKAKAA